MNTSMSKIRPALTAEEWGHEKTGVVRPPEAPLRVFVAHELGDSGAFWQKPATEHQAAALCLHGQPFGFTWIHVRILRSSADLVEEIGGGHYHTEAGELRNIADRIEALLPPED